MISHSMSLNLCRTNPRCPYLQWLRILTPDKVLLRSNKAHFTFLILLPTALVLAHFAAPQVSFLASEHARELLPQDFCTSFFLVLSLFYWSTLDGVFVLLFHLLGMSFLPYYLDRATYFFWTFSRLLSEWWLSWPLYTLISSLSILHFKRQKGEMKLPSFPGFCFLPSLITLPCTEYFPCLFVSATGIKASI